MKKSFLAKILTLTILSFATLTPLWSAKYTLIFGTNYENSPANIPPLELCEADAKLMKEQIAKTGTFISENVRIFLGAKVTREEMQEQIVNWLGKKVKPGDEVFFYFAGHGTFQRDPEAKNGMRNFVVMFTKPHVADNELSDWFAKVNTKKTIIIFDCCYSGGIAKKGAQVRGSGNIPIPENSDSVVLQDVADVFFKDKVVIGSSDDNETSIELGGEINHGVFTYYFSKAILEADLNNDKKVTAYEAFFKSKEEIVKMAASVGHDQHPQISGDASGFFFVGEADKEDKQEDKKDDSPFPKPPIDKNNKPKPPINEDEPDNEKNTAKGNLLIKSTIRKKILLNNPIEVFVDGQKVASSVRWMNDPKWQDVAHIQVNQIVSGVHNITVKAKGYPDSELRVGIVPNKNVEEKLMVSRSGRGGIEGHVWVGAFGNPFPNLKIFLSPTPEKPMNASDEKGLFVFNELKPGKYRVFTVGGLKYFTKPYQAYIEVKPNEITKVEIVLKEFYKK